MRREADYANYEAWQLERSRLDEITDASERLAAPMHNSFDYQLGLDGQLYFQGQSLEEVFETGIKVAEELVKTQPQFSVELLRRHIEHDEYRAVQRLALGTDGEPDVLAVLSPLPDVALDGADLGAYDVERQKTMLRVFERTAEGIRATSISLDRSDRDGLQAVAGRFDETIADDATSEEILAMRLWGYDSQFKDSIISKELRREYDQELAAKYGGEWCGGRQDPKVKDAKHFIEAQTDLLNDHLAMLRDIEKISDNKPLLEQARYNFAAALTRRLKGESDAASLAEAGGIAMSRGESYSNDCPTGTTAAQTTEALGFNSRQTFISKQCPICGAANITTTIEGDVISGKECGCKREICGNRVTRGTKLQRSSPSSGFLSTEKQRSMPTKKDKLIARYGHYAYRGELRIGIGGKEYDVHDSRSGELLGTIGA